MSSAGLPEPAPNFNPLPRKEGDISENARNAFRSFHFNPLPRKEGDLDCKGACYDKSGYFNPLPRKEGDPSRSLKLTASIDFNPLPRKEGDKIAITHLQREAIISIHSLVKRETNLLDLIETVSAISIHSLVKRETAVVPRTYYCIDNFNPLPRKEGDGIQSIIFSRQRFYFNPLPRKEGDSLLSCVWEDAFSISIHSLVKRETADIRFQFAAPT